jgi:hypothetical protein
VGGLEFVGLELLAVFPIYDPLAGRFNMLARRHRGRAANDCYQVLPGFDLHLKNGKTVLGVVVGDSLDEAGQPPPPPKCLQPQGIPHVPLPRQPGGETFADRRLAKSPLHGRSLFTKP